MAIKTGRADGTATVTIDYNKCTACGLCVKVCIGNPLFMDDGRVKVDQTRLHGCRACGQCVAVCPVDCISISGRDLFPEDKVALPLANERAGYEQLYALLLSRRSVRNFKDQEIEQEIIEKIIAATTTAPMGWNPSDIEILIFKGREKIKEFTNDLMAEVDKLKMVFNPVTISLLRPFLGRVKYDFFKTTLIPILKYIVEKNTEGENWLCFDAPLAMYFHSSPYSDPADPLVSATYAMVTGHALGLGTCMISGATSILKYSPGLRKKYCIPSKNHQGILVLFGYPAVKYQRALTRRLSRVDYF